MSAIFHKITTSSNSPLLQAQINFLHCHSRIWESETQVQLHCSTSAVSVIESHLTFEQSVIAVGLSCRLSNVMVDRSIEKIHMAGTEL